MSGGLLFPEESKKEEDSSPEQLKNNLSSSSVVVAENGGMTPSPMAIGASAPASPSLGSGARSVGALARRASSRHSSCPMRQRESISLTESVK